MQGIFLQALLFLSLVETFLLLSLPLQLFPLDLERPRNCLEAFNVLINTSLQLIFFSFGLFPLKVYLPLKLGNLILKFFLLRHHLLLKFVKLLIFSLLAFSNDALLLADLLSHLNSLSLELGHKVIQLALFLLQKLFLPPTVLSHALELLFRCL